MTRTDEQERSISTVTKTRDLKEIDGITCDIQTENGFSFITIEPGDPRLNPQMIVRDAPELAAEEIASIIIQHLLKGPPGPSGNASDDERSRWFQTPEGQDFLFNMHGVTHENFTNHATITFWRGGTHLFTLTHKSIE
jgi:hypothetical protein